MTTDTRLILVRAVHTAVWAFFAGCIVAIPLAAFADRFEWVVGLAALVAIEVLVLFCNRMRCPLTNLAGRYTSDRRDNFDIFLPEWLARHNKIIFGTLYAVGLIFALARWVDRGSSAT